MRQGLCAYHFIVFPGLPVRYRLYRSFAVTGFVLGLHLMAVVRESLADTLPPLKPVELEPGALLSYPLHPQKLPGQRLEIRLGRAPEGARVRVNDQGELYVHWRSSAELPADSLFEVRVRDMDSGEWLSSRYLLVHRKPINDVVALSAIEIEPVDDQIISADEPLTLNLAIHHDATENIQVLAADLPQGAVLAQDPGRGYAIHWTPSQDQLGRHVVRLRAYYLSNPTIEMDSELYFEVVPPPQHDSQQPQDITERPAAANPYTDDLDPDFPTLTSIPNQVVSAGRVVVLRMAATTRSGDEPENIAIEIDRLPTSASLDRSVDGSHTFYWRTTDDDQGEHVFRFTAYNRQEPHLRSSQDVLVIVGDPSRSNSSPDEYLILNE